MMKKYITDRSISSTGNFFNEKSQNKFKKGVSVREYNFKMAEQQQIINNFVRRSNNIAKNNQNTSQKWEPDEKKS